MLYRCIYCGHEKNETEFNVEHVMPRMLGKYTNAHTLANKQVCQSCNSYFSENLEDAVGLSSYEAYLRVQCGYFKTNGRKLNKKRVNFSCEDGYLSGLDMFVVVDRNMPDNYHFEFSSVIGIIKDNGTRYDFYSCDSLPAINEEIKTRIRNNPDGIISVNVEEDDAVKILSQKGYIGSDYQSVEVTNERLNISNDVEIKITSSLDEITKRLWTKICFNYLCFVMNRAFVEKPEFNAVRRYIRYNESFDEYSFRYKLGNISGINLPNSTSHAIGFALKVNDKYVDLFGVIDCFGEISYYCYLGRFETDQIPNLPKTFSYYDNEKKEITSEDLILILND